MWGRIVFGTDGSPSADRAGEVAATLARASSSELIVITGSQRPRGMEGVVDRAVATTIRPYGAWGSRSPGATSRRSQGACRASQRASPDIGPSALSAIAIRPASCSFAAATRA